MSGIARESTTLPKPVKKCFNSLILLIKEKVTVSFGPVGRNMARKSPKIEIFSIGQKI